MLAAVICLSPHIPGSREVALQVAFGCVDDPITQPLASTVSGSSPSSAFRGVVSQNHAA